MNPLLKNASLRTKLTFSHIVLIAIPTIVVIVFFYTTIYDLIVNNQIRQEQNVSLQTATTLSSTLDQVTTVSKAIETNLFLKQVTNLNYDSHSAQSAATSTVAVNAFVEALEAQIDSSLITGIKIYTDDVPDTLFVNPNTEPYFSSLKNTTGSYWHGIFVGTNKESLFCPSFYLTTQEIKKYGDLAYIKKLYPEGSERDSCGFLAVYFNKEALESILKGSISVNNGVAYIMNERDSIAVTSDKALSGTYLMDYNTIQNIGNTYHEFITKTVLGKEVYTGCHPLSTSDWYMVSVLPSAPIIARGNNVMFTFIVLYLIMLAIAYVIANYMAQDITHRVEIVIEGMRSVRHGPPIRMPESTINDEIGDLTDTYNYMADQMNQLLEDREKAAEELRVSEVRALQAQINPHFLYNTMEMINWLSQTGQREQVTEAIQALSKFYKLTLSKKELYGTIASETEHIKLYVQLQNMRYHNKIHLVCDIPEEFSEVTIPKLTFQPVVENAILHGILEKESGEGTIVLTGWPEGNDLIIQISDDGVGIPAEDIPYILGRDERAVPKTTLRPGQGTNIGIYNTHRRLRVLFGPSYGLTYESVYGEGTDVTIKVPFTEPNI